MGVPKEIGEPAIAIQCHQVKEKGIGIEKRLNSSFNRENKVFL